MAFSALIRSWIVGFTITFTLLSLSVSAQNYVDVGFSSHMAVRADTLQLSSQSNRFNTKAEYEPDTNHYRLYWNAYWEYDSVYDWRSSYSAEAESEYRHRFWLNDAYIQLQYDNVDISLGYQKIVWGQADNLRIVDVVNPLDFKGFVLPDLDHYRISLPMLRLDTHLSGWDLQWLGILDNRPNRLPPAGSEFPLLPQGLKQTGPGDKPEYGFRAQYFLKSTDIALYQFRAYADDPVLDLSSSRSPRLVYARETLWGLSLSRPVSDWIGRAEFAYISERRFNRLDGESTSRPLVQWLLGIDYLYRDWLFTTQISGQNVQGWSRAYDINRSESIYTLAADGRLFSDTLTLRVSATYTDYDGGGALYQTKLRYRPDSYWEWNFNISLLSGNRKNILGQFRHRDRVEIVSQYYF